jgi:hypothetical protein
MTIDKQQDNSFTIALPDGEDVCNVPMLIRWALKELEAENSKHQILIDTFYLNRPYISSDKPSITADFSIAESDFLQLDARNDISLKETLDPNVPEKKFMYDLADNKTLNLLVQRMPLGRSQHDAITLLYAIASSIEDLGKVEILDLILHDFLEENGLPRPYVHIYFKS